VIAKLPSVLIVMQYFINLSKMLISSSGRFKENLFMVNKLNENLLEVFILFQKGN